MAVILDYRKALLSSRELFYFFAVLEGDLKETELTREEDLLIIQCKKCYKNALMHFLRYGKTVLTASKVY